VTDISEKWGVLVAQRGFAQVPNHLLLLNAFLDEDHKLSATELLVLIQLVGTWWKTGDLPFPSMTTLATRCGVSSRQIQRSIDHLEKLGFIQRVKRRTKGIVANNAYDLEPLVTVLTHVAKAFPNPYPRVVDRQALREVNERIRTPAPEETAA
jgi:predicted transcriptional regulator